MAGKLHEKVALVTGGSRGIGRAIAERLASEGAAVVLNFTASEEKAKSVVSKIRESGGRAIAVQADVASKQAVNAMVEAALKAFGAVDILVNNAGILLAGNTLQLNENDLDRMIGVNVKGIIYAVQAVAPSMIARRYGKIINLSSIAGLGTAMLDTTPYAITKAAVVSLTKRLALELGPHGINVNAISPGVVRTEMLQLLEDRDRARIDMLSKKAILNRIGAPEDIAGVALFLASDESSYMTAQILTVDGGRMDFLTHSV